MVKTSAHDPPIVDQIKSVREISDTSDERVPVQKCFKRRKLRCHAHFSDLAECQDGEFGSLPRFG